MLPSRRVLLEAQAEREARGHDNSGALSLERGFLPWPAPRAALEGPHVVWDQLAEALPDLYSGQRVRSVIDALPVLDASAASLDDVLLQRAALLLGVFAHSYWWVEVAPPAEMAPSIAAPWRQVCERLGRSAPCLTYHDVFLANWRPRAPGRRGPVDPRALRMEDLEVLVPVFGNAEERVFLLAQVEIAGRCTGLVSAVVEAQEAASAGDTTRLADLLFEMAESLGRVTRESLLKIDPNAHGPSGIDPVVWAKTVARWGVPPGRTPSAPSGTAAPTFQLMDVFLARERYQTRLGRDSLDLRKELAPRQREFLRAVEAHSVPEFVEAAGDARLRGALRRVVEAYTGEHGFLGVHRRKVFCFLETAYKVGRPTTTGGFSGNFHDRQWETVNEELELARRERLSGVTITDPLARVIPHATSPNASVAHVELDVRGQGLDYQPGDRCAVLPHNDPELVARTLAALQATGDEMVDLPMSWREALRARGQEGVFEIPLGEVLRQADLRPLARRTAEGLFELTGSPVLRAILDDGCEGQWELWDVLELLTAEGFDPRCLWRAAPWQAESLCRMVRPQGFRMYSITSARCAPTGELETLCLTVGALRYRASAAGAKVQRKGTASSFLLSQLASTSPVAFPIRLSRPPRFHLPPEPGRPIVMFAGGTGIAPFPGFLAERARRSDPGRSWLFFSTRTLEAVHDSDVCAELAAHVGRGRLDLRMAVTREDRTLRFDAAVGELVETDAPSARIDAVVLEEAEALWELLRDPSEGGSGAVFYICGGVGFAGAVIAALGEVAERHGESPAVTRLRMFRMAAAGRLMQDVFSPSTPGAPQRRIDASELSRHSSVEAGYWTAIHGGVYDLGEFVHLHPGGRQVIASYAGGDSTRAWEAVGHHRSPEIRALLGQYKVGELRRLDFGGSEAGGRLADLHRGWLAALGFAIELQNAVTLDYDFLDRALTSSTSPDDLTPFKLDLVSDVHERFVREHVAALAGTLLRDLWAEVAADVAPERAAELGAALDELLRDVGFEAARSAVADALQGADDAARLRLCRFAAERDRALVVAVATCLRRGLEQFERRGAETLTEAGDTLLDCLADAARALGGYVTCWTGGGWDDELQAA